MMVRGGPPPTESMHGARDRGRACQEGATARAFRSSGRLAAASPSRTSTLCGDFFP